MALYLLLLLSTSFIAPPHLYHKCFPPPPFLNRSSPPPAFQELGGGGGYVWGLPPAAGPPAGLSLSLLSPLSLPVLPLPVPLESFLWPGSGRRLTGADFLVNR